MNIIFRILLMSIVVVPSISEIQVDPHQKAVDEYEYKIWKSQLNDDKIPINAIEIEVKRKIPLENEIENKEIFFKGVFNVSVDKREHIYVPSSGLCVIYEFDKEGKLLSKYDKRGQGPGEFQNPSNILFYNDQIIVMDNSVARITYFDQKWKYLKSISFIKGYKPFGIAENGNIYCHDPTNEKLVAVLDSDGVLIRKYGDIIFPANRKSPLNMVEMALSPEGKVWVGFAAYGIIREYSEKGEILKEINLTDTFTKLKKSYVKKNIDHEKKKENVVSTIIDRIAIKNEDIYVTIGGPVNMIYKLNNNGKIKNTFYIKPKYYVRNECFYADIDQNNDEEYYAIVKGDGVYIGVYGRKQNSKGRKPIPRATDYKLPMKLK